MLIVVRADQDSVVRALDRHDGVSHIGPSSPTGWTALWTDSMGSQALGQLGETLTVAEACEAGEVALTLKTSSVMLAATLPMVEDSLVRGLADELEHLFAARGPEALREGLRRVSDDWEAVDLLEETLDLPELQQPQPTTRVLAYRGQAGTARFASRVSGPALVRQHGDGWLSLTCVDEEEDPEGRSHELAHSLSAGARRDAVLRLWRGPRGSAGLDVFSSGHVDATLSWNTGWVRRNDSGSDPERVTRLLEALGLRDVDPAPLHPTFGPDSQPGDPLLDVIDSLQIPQSLVAVMDGDPGLPPPAERVERTSGWRAWRAAASMASPPSTPRPVRLALAWITLIWLLAVAFVAVVFVAVVATDGSLGDQDQATSTDWLLLVFFGGLTGLGVPLTLWRFNRARR